MINPIELCNDELYFADKHYMSVSSWKLFNKCECLGLHGFGEPTDSMMVGSYVDAYISGELEKFKADHPEIISSRGASKGELKAEYKKAEEICRYIDTNPRLQQFLSGDKQTVMTGEISGVPFKIKIDSYSKGIAINDLKIMATVTDRHGNYKDFITEYGYDIQLGVYQEIEYQNTGNRLPCYIVAVTKENPINSVIIHIPQTYLDMARHKVESTVARYYDVKKGILDAIPCGICNVCIANRKETEIISLNDIITAY